MVWTLTSCAAESRCSSWLFSRRRESLSCVERSCSLRRCRYLICSSWSVCARKSRPAVSSCRFALEHRTCTCSMSMVLVASLIVSSVNWRQHSVSLVLTCNTSPCIPSSPVSPPRSIRSSVVAPPSAESFLDVYIFPTVRFV